MKILVAEEEPLMLKTLQLKLKKEGHEVFGCADGRFALEAIQHLLPDLVITDTNLPHLSGLQLISAVKSIIQKKIPVIVVSASAQDDMIADALDRGAADYIVKPFSLADIAQRIKKFIAR
ncbi:response regulator transcription factor [Deminuibacter soli]|nr:response regulator [Deminuibacter soli]